MLRPIHFLIVANDTERAVKFYQDVFGWQAKKMGEGEMEYWQLMTGQGNGIDGGIMRHSEEPSTGGVNAFVCTIDVPDFDEYHQKIMGAGGKVAMEKHMIPDYGWHGDYYDPEGNWFSIIEETGKM